MVATVGDAVVLVDDVDAREERLRATRLANALPRPGTSEGRQLRRWLTQVLVTARVVAAEAAAPGLTADGAPTEDDAACPTSPRGWRSAASRRRRSRSGLARALFVHVTAGVAVTEHEIADYHARNPFRFGGRSRRHRRMARPTGRGRARRRARGRSPSTCWPSARRREFRRWLDARRAELVHLAPGYEHPGDPRQPDNTHKH